MISLKVRSFPVYGFILGLFFGLFDAAIDFLFFYKSGSFWKELFEPSSVEIYTRLFVLFLLVSYDLFVRKIIRRLHRTKKILEMEIRVRKTAEKELGYLASHDPLTNVYNRRKLMGFFEHHIETANRYDEEFSVLLLDLDHFKNINDSFGHLEGDRVLVSFCENVMKEIRKSDILARYGGEEFMIIAPQNSLDGAKNLGEKIRNSTEACMTKKGFKVTVSVGVTQFNKDDNLERILSRADRALYEAKRKGRNCVVCL